MAVILPRTPPDGGVVFENRLTGDIRKTELAKNGLEMNVSCTVFPGEADSAEDLYSRAEANARASAVV